MICNYIELSQNILESERRICLPFYVSLFEISRWHQYLLTNSDNLIFRIIQNDVEINSKINIEDSIDLFEFININILINSMEPRYVKEEISGTFFYFDTFFERFSFFQGKLNIVEYMYPFSYEVVKENFLLYEPPQNDFQPLEVFEAVNSPKELP